MKALLRSFFIAFMIVAMYAGVSASTTTTKAFPGAPSGCNPVCGQPPLR
jgi:hypothetical protein